MVSAAQLLPFNKPISRVAYRAQHYGMLVNCLAAQRMMRTILKQEYSPPSDAMALARQRWEALLERDLQNVEDGLYPRSLLFQFPYREYLRQMPLLAMDVPRSYRRMKANAYRDLPLDVDLKEYPPYFRRNFHWQTDGYLSKKSAAIYDVGVELLFLGVADVMRRQIIPPVTRFIRSCEQTSPKAIRLLDVACGTGRTLRQLSLAHPKLRYFGLDLSPYYLSYAQKLLRDVEHLSLVQENAEQTPFKDGYFDVITSVHLFHELPRNARRNVYREMLRLLRPGGLLVIQDSCQVRDGESLAPLLGRFSNDFHEPFHGEYLKDDIGDALEDVGFSVQRTEAHFVAKVVIASKPERD